MKAQLITTHNLPRPFWSLQLLVLKEPDGEDQENRYFRDLLYMVDHHAEGGKVLLKCGPREAWPKVGGSDAEGA
jgi:hypothetical protein